jgi:1,4-dihydroxy-2-naphthoate polyprenyltransferase
VDPDPVRSQTAVRAADASQSVAVSTNVASAGAAATRDAHALWAMARPSQLVLILLVFATGSLVATWRAGDADIGGVLIAAGLLIPAGVAVHWANEAADAATDALTRRTPFSGGSGALAQSGIAPGTLTRGSIVLAGAVLAGALALIASGRLPVAGGLLLVAGLSAAMAYSVTPFALMRRGAGEAVNAILGGLLLPLYGVAAATGRAEVPDVLAFLPFMFITFCSVMATAWPDRSADRMTGKRTLQVRLEPGHLRAIYAVSALAWATSLGIATWTAAIPFGFAVFATVPSVWLGWAWYTRRRSPWPSVASMVGHIVATSALTVAAIVVAA